MNICTNSVFLYFFGVSVQNVDDEDFSNIVTNHHGGYEDDSKSYNFNCSFSLQVKLITNRMLLQAMRDKVSIVTFTGFR